METKQKYERALRVSAQPGRNPGVPLDLDWVRAVRVNRSAVERRAATIPTRRTVKKEWQAAWLLRAVTCVDLTTLQGDDTPSNVLRLCAKAQHPVRQDLVEALGATELGIVVGAVCVYHRYVPTALAALAGSGIPVAAVSTGFPAGLNPFPQRLEEIRASVEAGAREIDVVITRAHALAGDWEALYREVKAFREACGDAHLKVILGTGDLATLTNVARASRAAMMAGADFIKTSTGKEAVNATLPVGVVMTRQIREYLEETGHAVGFKPAGGIRSAKGALEGLDLMEEELGDEGPRARGLPGLVRPPRARGGPLPVRARPRGAAQRRTPRRAREHGQRQVDPRDPRPRHPARHPPLLPPRGVGAAAGERVRGRDARGCRRADHPVELPAAHGGLEGRPGARRRKHGGAQARGVHAAHGARVRRDRGGSGAAARRAERDHRRRSHRRAARGPPGRGQDRLHGLDRGGPRDSQGDRGLRQEALARARGEEPVHRVRRRRSRQRGRGCGGRDLVQPGAGLLRRLAAARA